MEDQIFYGLISIKPVTKLVVNGKYEFRCICGAALEIKLNGRTQCGCGRKYVHLKENQVIK